jgi:hypothetical protein
MHLKLVADEPGRHGIDDPIHIDGATMSTSPSRRKSSTVRNSSRPCVVVPDRFSERIVVQPSRFRAATWISGPDR